MPHDGAGVNCVKWYVGVAAMMKSAKLGRRRRDEEPIQADKLKNSDSLTLGDLTLFCRVVVVGFRWRMQTPVQNFPWRCIPHTRSIHN